MSYNRYSNFLVDGIIKNVPFIKLPEKTSDKDEIYKLGITRFDILSNKYYKDPNYGWLILLRNPELGSLEFKISDNAPIKIPFPLESSLLDYKNEILNYITYYGI